MVESMVADHLVTVEEEVQLNQLFQRYDYLGIAEWFRKYPEAFAQFLTRELAPDDLVVSDIHRKIGEIGFHGIFTTNFDRVFEVSAPPIPEHPFRFPLVYPTMLAEIEKFQSSFFAKIHGCVSAPNNVILSRRDFDELSLNAQYRFILNAFVATGRLVTIGCSLSDPEFDAVISDLRSAFPGGRRPRIHCLMTRRDIRKGCLARRLRDRTRRWTISSICRELRKDGLIIIPYVSHAEIPQLIEQLYRRAEEHRALDERLDRTPPGELRVVPLPSPLSKSAVADIGALCDAVRDRTSPAQPIYVEEIKAGPSRIIVSVPADFAARLNEPLEVLGLGSVTAASVTRPVGHPAPSKDTMLIIPPSDTDAPAPFAEHKLHQFVADQYRVYEPDGPVSWVAEAFRLARYVIFTPTASLPVPLARYFFVPTRFAQFWHPHRWRPTRRAAFHAAAHALLTWPLLTFVATLLCSLLLLPDDSNSLVWPAASAGLLALAGSLVCGPFFHVLGVGAGGIVMAFAFALANALLTHLPNHFRDVVDRLHDADPFVAVVNGFVGVMAHDVHQKGLAWELAVLLPPAAAITATAWLMGNPKSDPHEEAMRPRCRHSNWYSFAIITLAAFVGLSGVGAVRGLYAFLSQVQHVPAAQAFVLAAGLISALGYALCVRFRFFLDWHMAALYGLAYGLVGALLWFVVLAIPHSGHPDAGPYFAGLGTGLFHACFFTLSYAIAFRLDGRRTAFLAAAVEGVVGFVLFNSLLMR